MSFVAITNCVGNIRIISVCSSEALFEIFVLIYFCAHVQCALPQLSIRFVRVNGRKTVPREEKAIA